MTDKRFLAFDLGAESGRAVLGEFDGSRLTLSEVGRFPTQGSNTAPGPDGVRRWEFERIWSEAQSLLTKVEVQGPLDGVGVDTWGVDFGLLDAAGSLIESPVCYRDDSHALAMRSLVGKLGRETIWDATGIQLMPFNTLFQLIAAQNRNPALLENAKTLLFMPDLIASRLAGSYFEAERTIASTSQMLDAATHDWNMGLLEKSGLPTHFLPHLISAGTQVGRTPAGTPVFTTAGHDTAAAAVAAAPADATGLWAYISSGTWSLFGIERPEPLLSQDALSAGFSNEGGVDGSTRLLKNIMGLWLVQECRRSLSTNGAPPSYEELAGLAELAPAGGPTFDAADHRFLNPPDMPREIVNACKERGLTPPDSTGALIRCCLESLAQTYAQSLKDLNAMLGIEVGTLHIVGGGTRNVLLNQLTANACGIPVVAGPVEATAAGNIAGQMIGAGVLRDWSEARDLCRCSFSPVEYLPVTKL